MSARNTKRLGSFAGAILVASSLSGSRVPEVAPFPSLYRDVSVFEEALARAQSPFSPRRSLSGITVPHHLVAIDLIASAFRAVDPGAVAKVIILFPDHFKKTTRPFASTVRDFDTVFGRVATNRADVRRLLIQPDLVEDSELFGRDHGIGAVLPFVKRVLPTASVVPISVAISSQKADWDLLVEHLLAIVDQRTLVVQSTDFSHYLPAWEAIRRDQESLNVIATGDTYAVAGLVQPQHIDSVGAQYIQMRLQLAAFGAAPIVLFNANSQAWSDVEEHRTTSYMVQVYDRASEGVAGQDVSGSKVYCFAGDAFFGRGVAQALAVAETAQRVQARMRDVLNGCRLIVNLEGVSVAEVPTNPRPTTLAMPDAITADWLSALNVVAVGVANNHSGDLGLEAYGAMVTNMRRRGLGVLEPGAITDLGGFRIVALNDIDNRAAIPMGIITPEVVESVRRSKAHPPLFAFVHWGREYDPRPGRREEVMADQLRQAAVTLIVGAHPHVASRRLEALAGGQTLMAYSLGNFLFDQSAKHASGVILEVRVFDQGTYFARFVPIPNFFDEAREPARND